MQQEKKNVLIAEDKEYMSRIIETYLSKEFQCFPVKNGQEALSMTEKIDVAVVSTNIKGQNGEDLLTDIKEKWGIPVVMITNNTTSLIRISLLKKGADDVVVKPFNPEELALRVLRLVK